MKNKTSKPGPDNVGNAIPSTYITPTDGGITQELAGHLFRYALPHVIMSGFQTAQSLVKIFTPDENKELKEPLYCVELMSPKGSSITVVGIMIKEGVPVGHQKIEVKSE